jgi:hypothetical protein
MYVYTSSPKPIETDDARLYAKRLVGHGRAHNRFARRPRLVASIMVAREKKLS